jgi:aromatic-L-amino-acid/L-tryptophan decarboxylase
MEEKWLSGDISSEEFLINAQLASEWISGYLNDIEKYPVLSQVNPGDIFNQIPSDPPLKGTGFKSILEEMDKTILPGITHWNHPGFMAYFNSTSSSPGILAEFIIAAMNINGMLWRTSPSSAELETAVLNWLKKMCGLDESFQGIIYDTASVSSMHAIAAARERTGFDIRKKGMSGRTDLPC